MWKSKKLGEMFPIGNKSREIPEMFPIGYN
jgi:hypothetical protein